MNHAKANQKDSVSDGVSETALEEVDDLNIAIQSCKDVTTLGRFAKSVDPVRWVAQLQSHLEAMQNVPSVTVDEAARKAAEKIVDEPMPYNSRYASFNLRKWKLGRYEQIITAELNTRASDASKEYVRGLEDAAKSNCPFCRNAGYPKAVLYGDAWAHRDEQFAARCESSRIRALISQHSPQNQESANDDQS